MLFCSWVNETETEYRDIIWALTRLSDTMAQILLLSGAEDSHKRPLSVEQGRRDRVAAIEELRKFKETPHYETGGRKKSEESPRDKASEQQRGLEQVSRNLHEEVVEREAMAPIPREGVDALAKHGDKVKKKSRKKLKPLSRVGQQVAIRYRSVAPRTLSVGDTLPPDLAKHLVIAGCITVTSLPSAGWLRRRAGVAMLTVEERAHESFRQGVVNEFRSLGWTVK